MSLRKSSTGVSHDSAFECDDISDLLGSATEDNIPGMSIEELDFEEIFRQEARIWLQEHATAIFSDTNTRWKLSKSKPPLKRQNAGLKCWGSDKYNPPDRCCDES